MRCFRVLRASLVCAGAAFAQQAPTAAPLLTDQQAVSILNAISQHAARIEPMLQQLRPREWVAKGAPDTYVAQWNSTVAQFRGIQSDMSTLAEHPDRMTDGMRALFRVQASHQVLGSLMGGLRRYQNPALADLIEAVAAEDRGDIDRLEQYLLELAGEKEQQFTVVDREAQRCRATLSRQPAEPVRPARRPQSGVNR
jgi:hypothetical protein